jgi:hypothetical protein
MSDYIKFSIDAVHAKNADYNPVKLQTEIDDYKLAAGTYKSNYSTVSAVTSSGTTIDLGIYTTVSNVIVKNTDPTNSVAATFRTSGGSSNDQVLTIAPGDFIKTGPLTVASDLKLTATGAACECEVFIAAT